MAKYLKIYNSLEELKFEEIKHISELSYYARLKNAMILIRKVYAKQISENKKSKRIRIITPS